MLRAFILLLVSTLLIVATAWWYMNEAAEQQNQADANAQVEEGFLTTRKDFNDKLEEIKRRKSEVQDTIGRFESRKKKTTEELRNLGVTSASDLESNDAAKRKFDAIRQYAKDIEKLTGDIDLFNNAISAIESGLRELDRKLLLEEVGVNDKTYGQLQTIVKDLDDRLKKPESTLESLETQQMLDDILGDDDAK